MAEDTMKMDPRLRGDDEAGIHGARFVATVIPPQGGGRRPPEVEFSNYPALHNDKVRFRLTLYCYRQKLIPAGGNFGLVGWQCFNA